MTTCALCSADAANTYQVAPRADVISLCDTCHSGATGEMSDAPHWQCLNDAIWSTEPAVQVVAYRLLRRLEDAPWARDLLEIAYLEEDALDWAKEGVSVASIIHKDTNGTVLAQGDTVVLIKDLPVKGANFTGKRGTAVRGISLVPDNAAHIEGRVNGQRIVILTEFVKKQS